jgi:hypothetical protein
VQRSAAGAFALEKGRKAIIFQNLTFQQQRLRNCSRAAPATPQHRATFAAGDPGPRLKRRFRTTRCKLARPGVAGSAAPGPTHMRIPSLPPVFLPHNAAMPARTRSYEDAVLACPLLGRCAVTRGTFHEVAASTPAASGSLDQSVRVATAIAPGYEPVRGFSYSGRVPQGFNLNSISYVIILI